MLEPSQYLSVSIPVPAAIWTRRLYTKDGPGVKEMTDSLMQLPLIEASIT